MKLSQEEIISLLKEPGAYPHRVNSPIKTEETHISWILLTGKFAYKIKKSTKFGNVLDFSTLSKRKKYCQIEVDLNKVLCGDMYQGVVKIVAANKSGVRFANITSEKKALEYAVKMKEVPQKYRMDVLMRQGNVTDKIIKQLSVMLADFHFNAPTNKKIKESGQPKVLSAKIKENFSTLRQLNHKNNVVEKKLLSFIQKNKPLLKKRILDNKIKEIHGDLYTKNIFIVPFTKQKSRLYLYDRIEFNELLRYGDVAEDVGHLAMDLDFQRQKKIRKKFVQNYVKESGDDYLEPLVYFIMCYKASMRAKVAFFRSKNSSDPKVKRKQDMEGEKLFRLAEKYLELF